MVLDYKGKNDIGNGTCINYLQYVKSRWGLRTPSMLPSGYPALLSWRGGGYDLTRLKTSRWLPHVVECSVYFIHSFIYLFTRLFVYSNERTFIHSFIHIVINSLIHTFLRRFNHSCAYSPAIKMSLWPTKAIMRAAKTAISQRIHPVWSKSSLSVWRQIGFLATHWAQSGGSD